MQLLADQPTIATSTVFATVQPINEETSKVKIWVSGGIGFPFTLQSENDLESPVKVTKWVSNQVASDPTMIPTTDPDWATVYKMAI